MGSMDLVKPKGGLKGKTNKFHVSRAEWSLRGAGRFSWSMEVLHGSLLINAWVTFCLNCRLFKLFIIKLWSESGSRLSKKLDPNPDLSDPDPLRYLLQLFSIHSSRIAIPPHFWSFCVGFDIKQHNSNFLWNRNSALIQIYFLCRTMSWCQCLAASISTPPTVSLSSPLLSRKSPEFLSTRYGIRQCRFSAEYEYRDPVKFGDSSVGNPSCDIFATSMIFFSISHPLGFFNAV